jgi:hypothetical protein
VDVLVILLVLAAIIWLGKKLSGLRVGRAASSDWPPTAH